MQKEARLYEKLENDEVRCFLCNHRCTIRPSKFGVCGMRENIGGTLFTHAYGEVVAANVDPIEKKPLYHFLPGTRSFSIATPGCNFKCAFCQNWQISQMSKKERKNLPVYRLSIESAVEQAVSYACKSISYTYTEPTVFFEYAFDVARLAKRKGLRNVFVTNGFMTREALDEIRPYLDACNVDLKSFREDFYKKTCKGSLKPVLESIEYMKKIGIWVEVTTLVVPGENDSEQELGQIAEFIARVDPDMPWHVSRFHPDYKFTQQPPTPIQTMQSAVRLGKKAGLRFIYMGNVAGDTNTVCPGCSETVLTRTGYAVGVPKMQNGKCSFCGATIPGVFPD